MQVPLLRRSPSRGGSGRDDEQQQQVLRLGRRKFSPFSLRMTK